MGSYLQHLGYFVAELAVVYCGLGNSRAHRLSSCHTQSGLVAMGSAIWYMGSSQETQVPALGQEDPLKKRMAKRMATHSSILAGESHGQRGVAGHSPWGHHD